MAITGNDPCAAAMLHLFEFWTNAKLECIKPGQEPWIEGKTAKDISGALFNLYNEKSVRQRIKKLKDLWFIDTRQPIKHRKTFDYLLSVESVQEAIRSLSTAEASGKNTPDPTVKTPLENPNPNGKNAVDPTVKTPLGDSNSNGKNTAALYIRNPSFSKEIGEEAPPIRQAEESPDSKQNSLAPEKPQPELAPENLKQGSDLVIPPQCDNTPFVHPVTKSDEWLKGGYKMPEWAIKRVGQKWIARQELVNWYAEREKQSKAFARDYLQKIGEEDRTNDVWSEYKATKAVRQMVEAPKPIAGTESITSDQVKGLLAKIKGVSK
jgi:hypothetical protein